MTTSAYLCAAALEWLAIHRTDLVENWNRAQQRRPLQAVEPLD